MICAILTVSVNQHSMLVKFLGYKKTKNRWKFKIKKSSSSRSSSQQKTMSFFSPLGTPTPLGSMAFDTNLDSRNMYAEDQNQTDELRQMDYHLREMEQFEQQKLEQSVEVSVIVCFFSFRHLTCFPVQLSFSLSIVHLFYY